MKTVLFYFSGTGNSYSVAKKLQNELGDCKLVSLMDYVKNKKYQLSDDAECNTVGFVFPLYYFSMPKAVIDFVENINLSGVNYTFAIITRGGAGWQGGALSHLKDKLKSRGYCLNAGFYVRMPDNYIPAYNIPKLETRKKYFKYAEDKLNEIISKIKVKSPTIEREYAVALRPLVHRYYLKNVNKLDIGFFADNECNSCGICEKICHFDNISIEAGKPNWKHNCQFCLACIHFCPKKAIQWKKGTKKRERYHHPDVTLNDYIRI